MSERYQRVVIGGQHSDWGQVTAGVPQGSVIGPLLFLLFINDITTCVKDVNIRLFADDTCIFIEVDNREETAALTNNDLERIESWASQWLINFSAKKTKSLTISNKPDAHMNPPLKFKNKIITEVNSHVYLGVTISKDLRWGKHIQNIAIKARQKLNYMLPLKYKLDRYSLQTMYNSFVLSAMTYACPIWSGSYNCDIQKLEAIHVDAMRLITGATARSNIESLYEETKFVPIDKLLDNRTLVFMYKILHGLCPPSLLNLIELNHNISEAHYNLRRNPPLRIPFARLETLKRSFIPYASTLWNSLDENIRNALTLTQFKKLLYMDQYKPVKLYFFGERLPAIHHARLRLGCSGLNHDLCCNLHVIPSSICKCGFPNENAEHFLLQCPAYQRERSLMIDIIQNSMEATLEHILFGNPHMSHSINCKMFLAVQNYIKETKRFWKI